jgi:uncharacterized protein (DUF885 family)
MPTSLSRSLPLIALALAARLAHAAPPSPTPPSPFAHPAPPAAADDARFDAEVAAYYAELPAAHPTAATELGLHSHDHALDDVSAPARAREIARLRGWAQRLAKLDGAALSPSRRADLLLLRASIDASLLELEEIRAYARQPAYYPSLASRAVYLLIKRDFAPAADRLRAVIARERAIPRLLSDGQKNLTAVPRVAVEIALDELPEIIGFFERDVPLAFSSVTDAKLKADLAASTRIAVDALRAYADHVKREILPRADAPFAIGPALFAKKLRTEEMIDTPLDELLARGEAELRRLQAEFKATAARIDPKARPTDVLAAIQKDHEPPERLIASVQARLAALRQFLIDRKIVSLPTAAMPSVIETPPYMRATTLASMDTPGAFEPKATEAYYTVTLPDPAWTPAQKEDFLRGAFSRSLVDVVSIHEAFPGHYVQFVWLPHVRSVVRKAEGAASSAEGWAHYCEQMILDEGFGAGDPKLRLSQLQDALLRAARYVVGIRMHTKGMTLEEAIAFFHEQGFQTKKVSEMEARRGSRDPTYLVYTWGKLEILALREAYKKKLGKDYSLQKFHDAFLAEGAAPLPIVRAALLGEPLPK